MQRFDVYFKSEEEKQILKKWIEENSSHAGVFVASSDNPMMLTLECAFVQQAFNVGLWYAKLLLSKGELSVKFC